jgi:hypothetical protein
LSGAALGAVGQAELLGDQSIELSHRLGTIASDRFGELSEFASFELFELAIAIALGFPKRTELLYERTVKHLRDLPIGVSDDGFIAIANLLTNSPGGDSRPYRSVPAHASAQILSELCRVLGLQLQTDNHTLLYQSLSRELTRRARGQPSLAEISNLPSAED